MRRNMLKHIRVLLVVVFFATAQDKAKKTRSESELAEYKQDYQIDDQECRSLLDFSCLEEMQTKKKKEMRYSRQNTWLRCVISLSAVLILVVAVCAAAAKKVGKIDDCLTNIKTDKIPNIEQSTQAGMHKLHEIEGNVAMMQNKACGLEQTLQENARLVDDSMKQAAEQREQELATVTAEISTMRLDMGDMQEALKAHDAWMEDVSQSLQEAHERCHQLSEDLGETRDQTQSKLDTKVDIVSWNDMNDDIDASIKTVRDMASALRLEVDSSRRLVDEAMKNVREELRQCDEKHDANNENVRRTVDENHMNNNARIDERVEHCRSLDATFLKHEGIHNEMQSKMEANVSTMDGRMNKLESELRKQDEDFHKEINDRVDGVERHHANVSKETSKRLNAVDLRISGLQGSCGEHKRDINKLRDETNSLTVKSAAHDVDIGKSSDDIRKLERYRAEDNQRHKQDSDAIYEELDQKVYEKNFQSLEDNVTKLTRGFEDQKAAMREELLKFEAESNAATCRSKELEAFEEQLQQERSELERKEQALEDEQTRLQSQMSEMEREQAMAEMIWRAEEEELRMKKHEIKCREKSVFVARTKVAFAQACIVSGIVNAEKGAEVCMAEDDSDHEGLSPKAQGDCPYNNDNWTTIKKDYVDESATSQASIGMNNVAMASHEKLPETPNENEDGRDPEVEQGDVIGSNKPEVGQDHFIGSGNPEVEQGDVIGLSSKSSLEDAVSVSGRNFASCGA